MIPTVGQFEGREHVLPLRVYYEDTDFTGVVYHASYLRFFERGRTEFLRVAGVGHRQLLERPDPCAFAVTKITASFHAAAKVDDALLVRTLFQRARGIRFEARQRLLRDGVLLAEGVVEVVCVSSDGRARRPPSDLLDALAPFVSDPAP